MYLVVNIFCMCMYARARVRAHTYTHINLKSAQLIRIKFLTIDIKIID